MVWQPVQGIPHHTFKSSPLEEIKQGWRYIFILMEQCVKRTTHIGLRTHFGIKTKLTFFFFFKSQDRYSCKYLLQMGCHCFFNLKSVLFIMTIQSQVTGSSLLTTVKCLAFILMAMSVLPGLADMHEK